MISNLKDNEQQQLPGHKLTVYLCTCIPGERLEWFKTIDTAGEKLTDQELHNAAIMVHGYLTHRSNRAGPVVLLMRLSYMEANQIMPSSEGGN